MSGMEFGDPELVENSPDYEYCNNCRAYVYKNFWFEDAETGEHWHAGRGHIMDRRTGRDGKELE